MPKLALPLFAIAAIGLVGCSEKAQNDVGQAANTMSADANATMARATNSVDAAADQAFGAAENKMDQIGNATDAARHKAGAAVRDFGNDIED